MLTARELHGAFTALVTPFRGEAVDLAAYDRLIDHQLAGGVRGIVPCGTTGESPTLDPVEQRELVARTVDRAAGRMLVIAGTGTNSTRQTVEQTRAAEAARANAAMIVMPYYNRPTQRGMIDHVRAVHDATGLPLVLYNVPSRTGSDLTSESVATIAEACPRVIGVKEATGNVLRTQQIVARVGQRLAVLSGDDALTLGIIACGGQGVISVSSNVAPGPVQRVVDAARAGDFATARSRHLALMPLHEALFVETNPGPVKAALVAMGLIGPGIRAPLAWPEEASVASVRAALIATGLLAA